MIEPPEQPGTVADDQGERVGNETTFVTKQPVENLQAGDSVQPVENAAPKAKLILVENAAPSLHQAPAPNACTSAAPVQKPVTPLESSAPSVVQGSAENVRQFPAPRLAPNAGTSVAPVPHQLPHEWRVTWKTTSDGVRSIWKRLYVYESGRWRYATREDKTSGKIPDIVINKEVKSFTVEAAKRIERIGADAIKRAIEHKLNHGRATGLRRAA